MAGTGKASFEDLVEIMMTLRGPEGCPWDREQTHTSIKRHLIEECYEVIDAIDRGEPKYLAEELGDVLLQVVFHSEIARQEGDFDISDVLEGIVKKLLGRHPHIFGDEEAKTADEVIVHWEDAKLREGKAKVLEGIPRSLPALLRAYKLQKKAARVGFDWEAKEHVVDKLLEEIEELKQVFLKEQSRKGLEEEIGDVLFTIVNVARHVDIDPEAALRKTIKKFQHRFEYVERQAEAQQISLSRMSLEEKENLWQEAKKLENESS